MPSPPPAAKRWPSFDHLQPITKNHDNTCIQLIDSEKIPTSSLCETERDWTWIESSLGECSNDACLEKDW